MTLQRLMQRLARWHIWLGWLVAIPLLMWTLTGLFMALRPIEDVRGEKWLARPAAEISLFEVVEAMEGPLGMTECSVHAGSFGIEGSCGVRANWRRINDVVAEALRGVSLAQMLAPPPALPGKPAGARAIPARLTAS